MTTQPTISKTRRPALNPDARSRQVAFALGRVFQDMCRLPLPVRLRAWDDSVAGPADGPEVVVRCPAALRRLLWHPTIGLLADAGWEVRGVEALHEQYVRTVRAWLDRLEARWSQAVDLVGEETARVWRLNLAGGALAFEQGRMGVDQVLVTRSEGTHR